MPVSFREHDCGLSEEVSRRVRPESIRRDEATLCWEVESDVSYYEWTVEM